MASDHGSEPAQANTKGRIQNLEERLTALVTSSDRLELLGAILDAFDNTIVVTDPNRADNPIIYVNGGFEKLTGYGPDEVIGNNCRFLQGEDRDQPGVKRLREAVEAGESVDVELRNYRKDGAMFWNHLYLSPVYDEEGKLVLFLGVQNDVTARREANEEVKRARDTLEERILERTGELDASNRELQLEVEARHRAEREVRDSESKLLDVLDHLLTFVAVLDPDGTLQYVNRAALNASNVTLAAVIGLPFAETPWWRFDAAVQERLREAIRKVARGETSRYDTRVQMSEDRFLTVDFMLAPVRDNQGNVTSLVASAADVTERERVKDTLQSSGERLELALESGEMGTWEWYPETGRVMLDGRERALFGLNETEHEVEHIDAVTAQIHSEDRANVQAALMDALERHGDYDHEFRVVHPGGAVRWLVGVGDVYSEADEPPRMVGINYDITERKETEETLRKNEEQRRVALESAAMGIVGHRHHERHSLHGRTLAASCSTSL